MLQISIRRSTFVSIKDVIFYLELFFSLFVLRVTRVTNITIEIVM